MNEFNTLKKQLGQAEIGLTVSEVQGFLTGILVNGAQSNWQKLFTEIMNEDHPLPSALSKTLHQLVTQINEELTSDDLGYQFLFRQGDLLESIEDLIGFVNHFLLGLGLMQPHLDRLDGDLKEAISDLSAITKLTYDETEDQIELERSFEEIKEYVKIVIFLCFDYFHPVSDVTIH